MSAEVDKVLKEMESIKAMAKLMPNSVLPGFGPPSYRRKREEMAYLKEEALKKQQEEFENGKNFNTHG